MNFKFQLIFNRGLFFLFLMIMIRCTDIVPSAFSDFETIPTINSIMVEGEPLSVKVTLTGCLDSMVLPNVENASIELYVDQVFAEQLEYTEDGIYTSKALVESGKEYQCKVMIPNFDTLVCCQSIPISSQILNVKYVSPAGIDDYGDPYSSTLVTFKNDPSVPWYFEIKKVSTNKPDLSYIPNHLIRNTISTMPVTTDPVLLNEGLPIALFSNETIVDSIYTMALNYSGSSSYPFVVKLRSITYDYYRYQKRYYLYSEGKYGDITTQTTAFPLYSNIENAYGIFAGYSVFVSDTITP